MAVTLIAIESQQFEGILEAADQQVHDKWAAVVGEKRKKYNGCTFDDNLNPTRSTGAHTEQLMAMTGDWQVSGTKLRRHKMLLLGSKTAANACNLSSRLHLAS